MKSLVVILLGSKSDLVWAGKIQVSLKTFGIRSEVRIASAHKSPEYALKIIKDYENKFESLVFIAVAGRSNALGGFIDANTSFPVINCPPPSEKYSGLDILSSLRMPSGVAPATVLEADQAALIAVKIISLKDDSLKRKVKIFHDKIVDQIKKDDKSL